MARIRSVHPGLFKDEAFVELSMCARVLSIGIWTLADDHGIFEWKPKLIRVELFPGDNVEIDALMQELLTQGCVIKFEDSGRVYGAIRNFLVYQRPREPSYRHPFPQDIANFAGAERRKAEELMRSSGKPPKTKNGNCDNPASVLTQFSNSPTEKRSHRRGEERREGERDNPKTDIESLERVEPGNVETMPSASPPGSLSEVSKPVLKKPSGPGGTALATAMGTELPENWTPDEELCETVKVDFGMTDDDIRIELTEFHRYHAAAGSFSANWRASFGTWCKRWKEHRDKQAPARVQLSNSKPWAPIEADWEKAIELFKKNESLWPRWAGNNPSSGKVPKHLLEKHGWDGFRFRGAAA